MHERFSKSSFDKGFMNVLFKDTQNWVILSGPLSSNMTDNCIQLGWLVVWFYSGQEEQQ